MSHFEFVTTEWERVEMSEATANHLGLMLDTVGTRTKMTISTQGSRVLKSLFSFRYAERGIQNENGS